MSGLAAGLMIGSSILNATSSIQQGSSADQMSKIAASQLQSNANLADISVSNEAATGQKAAAEELRQNKLLQSRQIALAAAGGASTSEKNIADLVSKTAGEGEYAALSALYEGNSRADALRNEAIGLRKKALATRFEGKQARVAGNIGAVSSILNSGSHAATFYNKYSTSPTMSLFNTKEAGTEIYE